MKKTFFFGLIASVLLSCTSNQNQKTNKKDDLDRETVLNLIKVISEREKSRNADVLSRVKNKPSTIKVIDWYYLKAPYYKPATSSTKINSISELKRINKKNAQEIKSLIISFGKTVDSTNFDLRLDKFKNLEYLQINNSKYVPINLKGLKKLKTLNFNYIYDLLELPNTIGDLKNLEHLLITGANKIKTIPDNIYDLTNLKTLKISGLNFYGDTISNNIKQLKNLTYFYINTCSVHLPNEIGELKNLKELHIDNYDYYTPYQEIYKLPNLEVLAINVNNDVQLTGISNLKKLRVLNIRTYKLIPEIAKIPNLEGLIINFNGDSYPKEFRSMDNLIALKIHSNYTISKAPDFIPYLKNLDYLEIRGCSKLSDFGQDYKKMKNISFIELNYNDSIKTVPKNLMHLKDKISIQSH